jgi:2-phospho-L-lactate guanylyltransferase (CobY/MobA/RfbA family)
MMQQYASSVIRERSTSATVAETRGDGGRMLLLMEICSSLQFTQSAYNQHIERAAKCTVNTSLA